LSEKDEDPYNNLAPGYDDVGEFYDLFADNSDLPLYLKYADMCGSPILDLASGTGRVSIALAKVGYDVVALEQSQSMLEVARSQLDRLPKQVANRITLVEGSMIDFSLNQEFSMIIIPTSFGHALTYEDQLSTLRCVHNHLVDDGLFIIDLFPGEMQYERASFEDTPVPTSNGHTVSRSGTIQSDMEKKLMRMDLQYTVRDSDGLIIKQVDVVSGAALIFNRDADKLVQEAGFEVVDELGDFEGAPYSPDSGRRILVLRRTE
jgi:SAM-dependent methyltransferase